jgi:hypothetical protein
MTATRPTKRRPRAIPIYLPLICFAASVTTLAQYRFDIRTTDAGLPNNFIYAIVQTRDGYL